jgi:crotonobetainyl-CoA:carnitine CoA-transferase CaiB-like acyl-CoA transferase
VAVLANQALNYLVSGDVPKRLGNAHPNIVPYQTFQTLDGHIIMAVGSDRQYADYCRLIGAPELASPPYHSNSGRVENREKLTGLLQPFMALRSTQDWVNVFEAASVPCGPINTIDQVFENPQVKARGLLQHITRNDGVVVPTVANPIVFAGSAPKPTTASPTLGQHTQTVLKDVLGLDDEQIATLAKSGVINQ